MRHLLLGLAASAPILASLGCNSETGAARQVRELAESAQLGIPSSTSDQDIVTGGGELAVLCITQKQMSELALERPPGERNRPIVRPRLWSPQAQALEIAQPERDPAAAPPPPRPPVPEATPVMIALRPRLDDGAMFDVTHGLGDGIQSIRDQEFDRPRLRAALTSIRNASPSESVQSTHPWSPRETLLLYATDDTPLRHVALAWETALSVGYTAPQFYTPDPGGYPFEKKLETLPESLGWSPVEIGGAPAFDGELLVLVDRETPYGSFIDLLFECAEARIWRISLVVDGRNGLSKLAMPLGTDH